MTTRVGGLATGIDTDTQVKNMLKGRQAQLDALKQKQTLTEWKQSDYQTLYSALSNFQKNTLTDFRLDKTLATKKATSTDDTKITATPNSDAAAGTHTLSVTNLAEGVAKVSTAKITSGTDKSTLATQTGLASDFIMAINGKAFTVSKEWSINDFATVLNAYGGDVKATYDTATDLFSIATTDQGAYNSTGGARLDFAGSDAAAMDFLTNKLHIDLAGYRASRTTVTPIGKSNSSDLVTQFGSLSSFDLVINGKTISVASSAASTLKMSDLINQINSAMLTVSASVSASYDTTTDRIFIANTDGTSTSAGTAITFGTAVTSATATAAYAAGLNFIINNMQMDVSFAAASSSALTKITDPAANTLSSVFGITGDSTVVINGTAVTLSDSTTISALTTALTSANVTTSYDSTTQRFVTYLNSGSGTLDFAKSDPNGMKLLSAMGFLTTTKTDVPADRTSGSKMTVTTAAATATMSDYLGMNSAAFTIEVNGETMTIDPSTMTIANALDVINNSGAHVKAVYDSTSQQVTLSRTDGSNSTIDFAGSSAAGMYWLTNNLKLLYTSPSSYAMRGKDANLSVDNIATTSHANTYTKDNVTYNLKTTTLNSGVDTPVTITVASDTDAVIANVKKFVEAYNALLAQFNTAIDTSRPKQTDKRSYFLPLTTEQKDAMKDDDITTWTKQAKTGLLHNDSILQSTVSALRSDVASPVLRYPTAAVETASTGNNSRTSLTLDFNEALYKSLGGSPAVYSAIPSGTDVTSRFQYTGSGTVDKVIYNIVDGTPKVIVTFKTPTDEAYKLHDPAAPAGTIWSPQAGDTIQLKSDDDSQLYNSRGSKYNAQAATLTATPSATDADAYGAQALDYAWTYPADSSKTASQVAANAWMTAEAVGISTDNGGGYLQYLEGGKLYINETTLKSALNADPDILKNIFGTKSATSDRQGIAVRMYNDITTQLTALSTKAGVPGSNLGKSALDTELTEYATRISDLTDVMADESDRYYSQFAAMESAIQQLNSQSSWISAQTGSK